MSSVDVIYAGNDTLLEVSGLQDATTGDFANAAMVTVALRDSTGANVAGVVWPLPLVYVPNSDGLYRVTLPGTLTLLPNAEYSAEVVADAGPGLRATWELPLVCRTRRS